MAKKPHVFLVGCEYCLKPIAQGEVYLAKIEINKRDVEIYMHSEGQDPNQPHPEELFVDCARNFRLARNSDITGKIISFPEFKKKVQGTPADFGGHILLEDNSEE